GDVGLRPTAPVVLHGHIDVDLAVGHVVAHRGDVAVAAGPVGPVEVDLRTGCPATGLVGIDRDDHDLPGGADAHDRHARRERLAAVGVLSPHGPGSGQEGDVAQLDRAVRIQPAQVLLPRLDGVAGGGVVVLVDGEPPAVAERGQVVLQLADVDAV